MLQQTALDFYIDKINEWFKDACVHCELCKEDNEIYQRAKQMEKEQIMKAASVVLWNNSSNSTEAAEQYYNETYGDQTNSGRVVS